MKTSLLLLHGAIGASHQMQAVATSLSEAYDVHLFDFPGHGGTPFPGEPFSISLFADATLAYIKEHQLEQLTIFGYSMGGYVALYLARHHPQLVTRIITLGTKFQWDPNIATRETRMLDPETILAKVPAFADTLAQTHTPDNWKEVLQRTAGMLTAMGQHNPLSSDDYKRIATPVLLLLGDRDKMVTLEETVSTYQHLQYAQLSVLPGTAHPIEQADAALLAYLVQKVY